jgi:hypothetical protein
MKKTVESINQALAEWNPIGVGEDIATDEYRSYISLIIKSSESKDELMKCLQKIVNEMDVGFDPNHKEHTEDLDRVCNKIIQITQSLQI